MDDDWRLQINLEDEGVVGEISDHLRSSELEHDLAVDLDKRVILSHEGETIYLYAGDRDQLDRARPAIEKFLDAKGWKAEFDLRHWHKEADEWESPDAPEPTTAAEREAEHERRIETEDEETEERRRPRRVRGERQVSLQQRGPSVRREAAGGGLRAGASLALPGRRCRRRGRRQGARRADPRRGPADAEVKAEYSLT